MIDRVNTSQLQDILANPAAKQSRNAEPGQNRSPDASLQADYAAIIKQATAAEPDDLTRVAKANELLRAGELEKPQNIAEAAQNIADFGI